MNELITKIKELDKKVLIGFGISAAILVIFIIALVASDANKSHSNIGGLNSGTQDESQGNDITTELHGIESTTEALGSEGSTEMLEIETETITEDGVLEQENANTGSTTVNPDGEEIIGTGKPGEPYMEILGEDYKVTTVAIASGASVYYDIYRVGGLYLTINDPDAYVIYNGTTYQAKNGVVAFTVGSALASDAVRFEIGNNGSTAKSFEIKFSNLKGSYQNPERLTTLGTITKNIARGNEIGYYYVYTAEKTGKIRFEVTGTNACDISVTNKRNSANRTYASDVLVDAQGKEYIELEVNAGDEIRILIYTLQDDRGRYPATDITWSGFYQ